MSSIHPGRMTHDHDGELVVFLIGMRVNRLWRPDVWGPAFAAMGPMLTELSSDPDSGLLGYHTTIGDRGPLLVQYWASVDKLYAYAADTEAAHRPAWARFNQRVRRCLEWSGSGTRRMSSRRPSRSTSVCRRSAWPGRPGCGR